MMIIGVKPKAKIIVTLVKRGRYKYGESMEGLDT